MFKKVLFSLLILTMLTACGNSDNNTIRVTLLSTTISHAMNVCRQNGGLDLIRSNSKGNVITSYQSYAECKNRAVFKLPTSIR